MKLTLGTFLIAFAAALAMVRLAAGSLVAGLEADLRAGLGAEESCTEDAGPR